MLLTDTQKECIKQDVLYILDEENIDYEEQGIDTLIDKVSNAKDRLRQILSRHPKWDERQQAIILNETDERIIYWYKATRTAIDLKDYFYCKCDINATYINLIISVLRLIIDVYYDKETNISEAEFIENIKKLIKNETIIKKISLRSGQKINKILNKIVSYFGLDNDKEYQKLFATMSDAVTPLKIERWTILSIHPADFLWMSHGTEWKSCHRLDGEYRAGTLSYACDKTSMVLYTVDGSYPKEDIFKQNKINRQIYCYDNFALLQSRLYPNYRDTERIERYRHTVQTIMSICLQDNNFWVLNRKQEIIDQAVKSISDLHYPDYDCNIYKSTISYLKSHHKMPNNNNLIEIGSDGCCLNCGGILYNSNTLSCCTNYFMCEICGQEISEDDGHWIHGTFYCDDCAFYCDYHHTMEPNEDYFGTVEIQGCEQVICRDAEEELHVCEHCGGYMYDDDYIYLEGVGIVCYSCEELYVQCKNCEEYHLIEENNEYDEENYCKSCFTELFSSCSKCDEIYLDEELEDGICPSCRNEGEQ